MGKIVGLHGGNGGFGSEVLKWASKLLEEQFDEILIVNDFVKDGHQEKFNGFSVVSPTDFLAHQGNDRFFSILIGDSGARERIWHTYIKNGIQPTSLVAPSADINTEVTPAIGAVFCQNTIVTTDIKIGRGFQGNIYSYIAHHCVIGDFVTFAPRVCCNGRIHIEDGAYIGTGAILRAGSNDKPLTIGKGAIVGMGAVVTKDVAPGTVVVGNPARPLQR